MTWGGGNILDCKIYPPLPINHNYLQNYRSLTPRITGKIKLQSEVRAAQLYFCPNA